MEDEIKHGGKKVKRITSDRLELIFCLPLQSFDSSQASCVIQQQRTRFAEMQGLLLGYFRRASNSRGANSHSDKELMIRL